MRRAALPLGLLAALAAGSAAARAPELGKGASVATSGTAAGAPACASCHGADGTGTMPIYPRLTGQAAFYMYKQLQDFRSGQRESATMGPIAQQLTEDEMQDVAGYYASLTASFRPPPPGDGAQAQHGGALAAIGSPERNIPACANCHGRAGVGLPPSFPYLAGQYGRYLRDQLGAFRDGSRRNDPMDVMRDIAGRLSERDIEAVADYFAHVYPPALSE